MGRAEDLYRRFTEATDKEAVIDDLIAEAQSEEMFLDYKMSATPPTGTKLADSDLGNFAEAISGFGNIEGGLIVWGVRCKLDQVRGDVPDQKIPVQNPQRFKSLLDGLVSAATVPAHPHVESLAFASNSNPTEGFVVTLVSKSDLSPHQVLLGGKHQGHYMMRSGSSFVRMPHAVLSAFFGRRPEPKLELSLEIGKLKNPQFRMFDTLPFPSGVIECEVTFGIRNAGCGLARFPAIRIKYATEARLCGLGGTDYGLQRRIEADRPGIGMMFAGGVDTVIHPSSNLDVGKLLFRMTGGYMGQPTPIHFELYCEGDSKIGTANVVLAQKEGEWLTF